MAWPWVPDYRPGWFLSVTVFISYHRDVAGGYAHAIYEYVKHRHACEPLLDEHFIQLGQHVASAIEQAIHKSRAFIFIIHPGWLTPDASGRRPLDDAGNWMRRELQIALECRAAILPILLDGATMPAADQLPAEIAALSGYNAVEMRASSMAYALAKLSEVLEPLVLGDMVSHLKSFDTRVLLREAINYPWNFLRLLFVPRRVALAFRDDPLEELVVSQLFLIISLVVFSIFSAPVFAAQNGTLLFLTVQGFMLWVVALGSSRLLQWAWARVGGAERRFLRYLSLNSYYCAISCLLGLWITLAALGVEIVFDRPFVDQLAKANLLEIAHLLIDHFPASLPLKTATAVLVIGNLLMLVWTFFFWDAYRAINKVGWVEAAGAFVISSVAFLPLGLLFVAVQAGMSYVLR